MSAPSLPLRRGAVGALVFGLRRALQWRLLAWWVLALALPALLATLPAWPSLHEITAHSVHVAGLASGQDVPLLLDAWNRFELDGASAALVGVIAAAGLSLLLSPWLTGMAVASIRARRALGLGELARGGLVEYARLLRTSLWSAVPFGLVALIGALLLRHAERHLDSAILEREITDARHLALVATGVLLLIAHLTIEAGRGWLGADRDLRSVLRAWTRGVRLVLRRPLAALTVYLGSTIAGLLAAALFGWWRLQVDASTVAGAVLGIAITQAAVAMLAWGRLARVYGFADLAATSIATDQRS